MEDKRFLLFKHLLNVGWRIADFYIVDYLRTAGHLFMLFPPSCGFPAVASCYGLSSRIGIALARPHDRPPRQGVVIREALDIRDDGRLRYGAWIDLTHQGRPIQLMSVHLNS